MNNNTHTNEYTIKNFLVKNINLNWDILIHKPEFLTKNISNVQFFLTDQNNCNSSILDNYLFKIVFNGSPIYTNYLKSNQDIFEYSDIPFEYIYYHQGVFILENIPKHIANSIMDYKINFIYSDSQTLQYFQANIQPISFEMKWNVGIKEEKPNDNKLRIMSGMIGCFYNSFYMEDEFYNQNHKIVFDSENLEHNIVKINYLDEHNNWVSGYQNELDVNTFSGSLNVLVSKKINLIQDFNKKNQNPNTNQGILPIVNENIEVLAENFKIPLNGINFDNSNYAKFISTTLLSMPSDGVSNIVLLCNNNKYTINKIYLDLVMITYKKMDNGDNIYEETTNTYEMEFDINESESEHEQGYKILGMSDFFVIPTIINNKTYLRIEFETNNLDLDFDTVLIFDDNNNILSDLFDDFWIKFDRLLMNTDVRKKLAQSSQDYEEYPIVNILEYYPKIHYNKSIYYLKPDVNEFRLPLNPIQLPINPIQLPLNPIQLPLNPIQLPLNPIQLALNNLIDDNLIDDNLIDDNLIDDDLISDDLISDDLIDDDLIDDDLFDNQNHVNNFLDYINSFINYKPSNYFITTIKLICFGMLINFFYSKIK
jgi:hypothetical protein